MSTKLTPPQTPGKGAATTVAPPSPTAIRWVAGVIVFFLIDAAQLLLLVPDRSDELFAWPIAPDLSAYVLASAYIAGAYFFVRVALGAPWNRVVAGFAPVTVFVWLVAIATLLHLDKFRDGSLPFLAWASLYAASPFGIPLLAVAASRMAGARPEGERLPRAVRGVLAAGGALVLAGALWVFADPVGVAGDTPWVMTPLTTRVVASVIALFGTVWVSVAVDGRRSAATIVLEALATGLTVMLAGVLLGGVGMDRALAPVLVGGGAAMLAATLAIRLTSGATRARVMR
jgi:hypothetical protein